MNRNLKPPFKEEREILVVMDFDGTISQSDVVDALLDRYGQDGWKEAEAEWLAGRLSSDRCLSLQLGAVRISQRELKRFLQRMKLDPGFMPLRRYLSRRGIPLWILSDSFDCLVRVLLHRYEIRDIPFRANRLSFKKGTWVPSFPYLRRSCGRCAHCKGASIREVRRRFKKILFIGDGLSDRCAVGVADRVYAKGHLADFCSAKGIACRRFRSLSDVLKDLKKGGLLIQ